MSGEKLFLVAYNRYFSRKTHAYLEKKKLKPEFIGEHHFLVKAKENAFEHESILPFLIHAQPMKRFTDDKKMRAWIVKNADKNETHALRGWSVEHEKLSGRDLEVKNGIALEKMGMKMNPNTKHSMWFILWHKKKYYVSEKHFSLDAHFFPYADSKTSSEKTVTRSGKKLSYLLAKLHVNVSGKTIADLGCGSGGWTESLLERGAKHVFAIDKTTLDKKLQKNKRVTYIAKKAEEAPKLKEKIDMIVGDINVNPAHARKILLAFAKKNPHANEVILTQKVLNGKELSEIPKMGAKIGKWTVKHVTNTWWARREYYIYLTK